MASYSGYTACVESQTSGVNISSLLILLNWAEHFSTIFVA